MIHGVAIAAAALGGVAFAVALTITYRDDSYGNPERAWPRFAAFLAAAVAFFVIAAGLLITDKAFAASFPFRLAASGGAQIDFVDVGQGDAVVMRIGKRFVVSDAGDKDVGRVNEALKQLGAHAVDVAILTHPNRDHVANFAALVNRYHWRVRTVVLSYSNYWDSSPKNARVLDALRREGAVFRYVTADQRFRWGGASWEILNPQPDAYTGVSAAATNNVSVVYALRVYGVQALFTGDIGPAVAKRVAAQWTAEGLGRAAIFLATHHGSKTGSITALLQAIRPRWAVLSTGPNTHHHPTWEAIERLKGIGASIWCTAANGTVSARIARGGRILWQAAKQPLPWWSATLRKENGDCVGH